MSGLQKDSWQSGASTLLIGVALLGGGYLLGGRGRDTAPPVVEPASTALVRPAVQPLRTTDRRGAGAPMSADFPSNSDAQAPAAPHLHEAPPPVPEAANPARSVDPAQAPYEDPVRALVVREPQRSGAEPSPIRVEQNDTGLVISSFQSSRTLQVPGEYGTQSKSLQLDGFDIKVSGPGGFTEERSYAAADFAVVGSKPGMPDGLYKYTVTPRLQPVTSLPAPPGGFLGAGGAPVSNRNGRSALDPRIAAGELVKPLEASSGTFRIQNGQVIPPGSESNLYPGSSDTDTP